MILYTIVPNNYIFSCNNSVDSEDNFSNEFKQTKFGRIEGKRCDEGFRINRLISTNPLDYLNPDYYPGNIID